MKLDELRAELESANRKLEALSKKLGYSVARQHEYRALAIMAQGNVMHAAYLVDAEIEREREDAMAYQHEMENA